MAAKKEKIRGAKKTVKTWDYVVKPGCDINGTKTNKGRKSDYNKVLEENLGITNLTASQLFSMSGAKK